MFEHILEKANLTPTQASILEYLYANKSAKASKIAKEIRRSRAIIYRDLEELVSLNIVEKIEKAGKIAIFRANHPTHIEKLIDQKENQIKKDRELFKDYLPDLISSYNLINNKPGIKFYEGKEGIEYVLWDTLDSQDEICTIVDSEHIKGIIDEINRKYMDERIKCQISKKIIEPESNRKNNLKRPEFTQIRYLKDKEYDFKTAMQIYSNKVSYQTLEHDHQIGVIIEDKNIYRMHKALFDYLWENAIE